jgi:hypothetical protein
VRQPPDNERGRGTDHPPDLDKSQLDAGGTQNNRHLDVALETASAGWPVIPCGPKKRPAIPKCQRCEQAGDLPGSEEYIACARSGRQGHGLYDASTSPHRIESWWKGHPEYLVATPTEGLIVVDLDEPNDGPTGETWAWWCQFAEPHGWDPTKVPIVATPRGGVHLYWRQPDGVDVRCSESKLAPGVDIRANGGYIIVPGSRGYELLSPYPRALINAFKALITECTRSDTPNRPSGPSADSAGRTSSPMGGTRYGLQALEGELGRLALTPEGQRNASLNTAAFRCGQLAAGGQLDPVHAAAQLHAVALRIGLGEKETVATIKSGMTNGARNPRRPAA